MYLHQKQSLFPCLEWEQRTGLHTGTVNHEHTTAILISVKFHAASIKDASSRDFYLILHVIVKIIVMIMIAHSIIYNVLIDIHVHVYIITCI